MTKPVRSLSPVSMTAPTPRRRNAVTPTAASVRGALAPSTSIQLPLSPFVRTSRPNQATVRHCAVRGAMADAASETSGMASLTPDPFHPRPSPRPRVGPYENCPGQSRTWAELEMFSVLGRLWRGDWLSNARRPVGRRALSRATIHRAAQSCKRRGGEWDGGERHPAQRDKSFGQSDGGQPFQGNSTRTSRCNPTAPEGRMNPSSALVLGLGLTRLGGRALMG